MDKSVADERHLVNGSGLSAYGIGVWRYGGGDVGAGLDPVIGKRGCMVSTRLMMVLGRLGLCVMVGLVAGCACRKAVAVYTNPQQVIMVSPGQEFQIWLAADRAGGLEWQAPYMDAGNLVLIGKEYPGTVHRGPAGEQTWTFRAVGQGDTFVPLSYVRVFEAGQPVDKTATFRVSIR